ncbi:hypothetical protein CC86DRAFT_335863 [Ophiobolus disseminans]|uniref:TM7S3/TM198-like domain-containing protein n=1 Tax=Ophiobolus disseminans TaxID=1469910 RepID=A0A6A6ZFN0_9PLEO|nr:hypothetical protein CC86DRAFT_335863 [Ophiobolus disseminans]
MRSYRFFLLCLALVLCLHFTSAVPHYAVRQQEGDNASQLPSSRPSTIISSSIRSEQASSTAESSIRPSGSTTATVIHVPATTDSVIQSSTPKIAENDPENPLPIHPKVTPAMGLAGALLLITGLVYAVIGIKNKWIYVFGSAAYLTSLAVVVLIIYLMNPPVSNGIQGAFFVAAFVTGCIFGVLSLVFADITEGFGCLLGGFCVSMWFLSLKDGGLISSTTGRAIFIGCMSAGGYSLSFSHYTRNYGLIGSISFSGATATILGIDCLSCAGWKEFWLYLWNLNEDIFPLNTNTYPVTKNIKAELAGVIIIAVFGVVSQLRVWNLVKDRRAKTAAQVLEKQQEQDREEEERGRNVEDNFQKERTQWEAAYGNKGSIPDSSVRTSSIASPKGSTSIKETGMYATDSVEMVNLSKSGVAADGTTVTVRVLQDDDINQIDAQGNPITHRTATPLDVSSAEISETAPVKRASLRSAVPPPPSVVPLPFTVPSEEMTRSEDGDNTSVSAIPESPTERRPMSKRVSDMTATNRFSMNRASRAFSESSEALVHAPYVEDDHASSVAATLDDDHDDLSVHQLSPTQSLIGTEHEKVSKSPTLAGQVMETASPQSPIVVGKAPAPPITTAETTKEVLEDSRDLNLVKDISTARPAVRQSLTSSTDPKPNEMRKNRSSLLDSRVRVDTVVSSSNSGTEQGPQSTPSQAERAESYVGSLTDSVLPERLSKVALSYRTNEWAKHLEAAEKPDLDDLASAVLPSTIPEESMPEQPAPVSDEIASPLIGSKRESKRVSSGSKANRTSGFGLNRSMSTSPQDSLIDPRSRARSPPVASPGVLSRSNSGDQLDALAPLPSNTLLGQRETLMRKRTSSQSFTPNSSASNLLEQADQENMSLAQRRQILQHHQATQSPGLHHQTSTASQKRSPPSSSQKWQNKGWATKGAPAGFDSHQPKRTTNSQSDQKREELYTGWRNNMQDVTPPQTQAYIAEQQRAALMNERRQKEVEKQQREAKQQQRASQLDSMMRSGHMLDAHREAMRKMQANASRNAS